MIVLLLLTSLFTGIKNEQPPIWHDLVPIAFAASVDYFGTEHGLKNSNVYELNFFGQSKKSRIVVKTVWALSETWIIRKLRDRNATMARIMKYLVIAVNVGIGIRNYRMH